MALSLILTLRLTLTLILTLFSCFMLFFEHRPVIFKLASFVRFSHRSKISQLITTYLTYTVGDSLQSVLMDVQVYSIYQLTNDNCRLQSIDPNISK